MTSFAEGSDETLDRRFNRAAVFANPVSGGGAVLKLLPPVEQLLHARGLSADIFLSSSAAGLESQVQREVDSGADLLISAGGDGTLHSLVNASLGRQIVYGVIPAGGGNDFARALGLPLRPILALELALAGELKSVDLVKVRNAAGVVRIYLGGGGVGLDSDAAELSRQRMRFWPGRLRYIAAAVCAFASYPARRIRILTDDAATEVPWQQAMIASVLNTPSFGAGIRLVPDAKIDDGLVDVAVRGRLGMGELLRVLPRLIATGSLSLPGLRVFRARKLRIETEPPVLFQGDGELLGYTPVEIDVLPGFATFLVPKRGGN
ncbi:MAG: diacylglycerol kinase family protein [Candidatus Acidiferrum sp.]